MFTVLLCEDLGKLSLAQCRVHCILNNMVIQKTYADIQVPHNHHAFILLYLCIFIKIMNMAEETRLMPSFALQYSPEWERSYVSVQSTFMV